MTRGVPGLWWRRRSTIHVALRNKSVHQFYLLSISLKLESPFIVLVPRYDGGEGRGERRVIYLISLLVNLTSSHSG